MDALRRREAMAQALLNGPEDMSASVDMIPQDSGFLQKLAHALATMPTVQSIKSAVTLPGDVYAGRQPMGLPSETEDLSRVADLAGLGMTGGIAGAGAGGMALGSGPSRPRTFFRGENPGDTRRITTGNEAWDSHLFASSNPESAKMYGSHLTKLEAAPDAKILYEGTSDFVKVAGRWRKDESLLDYSNRAAEAAKAAGYDAVHFKRQGDVGTAIINRDKFMRGD
jgi:hypothetical protein